MSIAKPNQHNRPTQRRTIRDLEPIISILRSHPDRWALIAEGDTAPAIQSLRNRYSREGFEFVARAPDRIYARSTSNEAARSSPELIWEDPPPVARPGRRPERATITERELHDLIDHLRDAGLSHDRVATRIGRSRRWVGDRLRGRTPITVGDHLMLAAAIEELAEESSASIVTPEEMSAHELNEYLDELTLVGKADTPAFAHAYAIWERLD